MDPVKDYKVLKKPKSDEALTILKRISSQVKPILIKRNWKIHNLCEFFPSNPNLLGLNMNKGWKINIRLRPHFDETQFLDYQDILGTLLHEMAHIVRGPHDEQFYKLLDELKEETELLMATGYKGEGFYSQGHRLGAVPGSRFPSAGIKLGGRSPPHLLHLTPAQQAAFAAEKRRNDHLWCGQSTDEVDNKKRKSTTTTADSQQQTKKKSRVVITIDDDEDWSCPSCTFLNREIALICTLCLTKKPEQGSDDTRSWICPQCTLVNDKKCHACVACNHVHTIKE